MGKCVYACVYCVYVYVYAYVYLKAASDVEKKKKRQVHHDAAAAATAENKANAAMGARVRRLVNSRVCVV
jgi:hypothetical protein